MLHRNSAPGPPSVPATTTELASAANYESPRTPRPLLSWTLRGLLKLHSNPPTEQKTRLKKETALGPCQCCATVLAYPVDAPKFKCTVCGTTNILVVKEEQNAPSHHALSFRYLQKFIEHCWAHKQLLEGAPKSLHEVFEPLSNYLQASFSSHACLNSSFRVRHSSRRAHYSSSNLDYGDIALFFDLLAKLPTKRPLYSALAGAVKGLKKVLFSFAEDPKNLYYVLILLEIPYLSRSLSHEEKQAASGSVADVPEIRTLCYDVLMRVVGHLAAAESTSSSNYIVSWLAKRDTASFTAKVDLINLYITFHLRKYFLMAHNPELARRRSVPSRRHSDNEYLESANLKADLEQFNADAEGLSALALPLLLSGTAPLSRSKTMKKQDIRIKLHQYGNDWHFKTASKALSLLVKANTIRGKNMKLPVSTFYNSLVDFVNIRFDFDSWQIRNKKSSMPTATNEHNQPELQTVIDYIHGTQSTFEDVSASYFFCQFPFLISLGGKISILEYEARRQMERKAEEAFINSLDQKVILDVYFKVRVRRDHIVADSLKCIQQNPTNLKKSLRVQFIDEPGVDAGGLKKEWFLLLTKSLFSIQAGMLTNVEDSNYLWFNIVPVDNFEMYYLFGAILGLAIYNSTILDLKFPLTLYQLLLGLPVGFSDYQELYPVTAENLLKLRGYTEEEMEALSLTFEVSFIDAFGRLHSRDLIPGGEKVSVTVENRELYIDKYARFFLLDSMKGHVEAFTKGFSNVIGGNALSLFLPEEIQLLLCGSTESHLDTDILRSVTKYVGWNSKEEALKAPVITWFWDYIECLTAKQQKKFLLFVTGSDRIPATGIQNLNFKISRLGSGKDSNRLPVAHTCFNELAIYEYCSREKTVHKLDQAVNESAGFGIK